MGSRCSRVRGTGIRCCGDRNINIHASIWFNLAMTVVQTKQRCEWQRKGEGESQHILGNEM